MNAFEFSRLKKKGHLDIYTYSLNDIDKDRSNEYTEIELKEVHYFEVIEIDKFNIAQKKTLINLYKKQKHRSSYDLNNLKSKLSKLKEGFDTISMGRLFFININDKRSDQNDLMSFADVSFIKTNESYLILKISVTPSNKFNQIFKKNIENKDISLGQYHFNSLINILKYKSYISHETFITSLRTFNIQNLLHDFHYQVKSNIVKHFNGYFLSTNYNNKLPSIELYEVENLEEFHKDTGLKYNFLAHNDDIFKFEENVEIYLSNLYRSEKDLVSVVKRKKGEEKNESDSYFLLQSLAFPCVFSAILNEQYCKLNKLKREIYDFINFRSNINILNAFRFLGNNKKYMMLKKKLIQVLLTINRFEIEFPKSRIYFYSQGKILKEFYSNGNKGKTSLIDSILEDISYKMEDLDKKTKNINNIFQSIEELNSYTTNFFLQLFSIIISVLALAFTFDKIKIFLSDIYSFLQY